AATAVDRLGNWRPYAILIIVKLPETVIGLGGRHCVDNFRGILARILDTVLEVLRLAEDGPIGQGRRSDRGCKHHVPEGPGLTARICPTAERDAIVGFRTDRHLAHDVGLFDRRIWTADHQREGSV